MNPDQQLPWWLAAAPEVAAAVDPYIGVGAVPRRTGSWTPLGGVVVSVRPEDLTVGDSEIRLRDLEELYEAAQREASGVFDALVKIGLDDPADALVHAIVRVGGTPDGLCDTNPGTAVCVAGSRGSARLLRLDGTPA